MELLSPLPLLVVEPRDTTLTPKPAAMTQLALLLVELLVILNNVVVAVFITLTPKPAVKDRLFPALNQATSFAAPTKNYMTPLSPLAAMEMSTPI
jgi:hypothetical protein